MTDSGDDPAPNFRGHVTQKAVVFGPSGDVLLVRSAADRPWSVPGGRVQDGEDAEEALARELREETGLSVRVGEPVQTATELWHTADGEPMFTVVYAASASERGVDLNHEHDEYEWVAVEDAARRLPTESLTVAVRRAVERR